MYFKVGFCWWLFWVEIFLFLYMLHNFELYSWNFAYDVIGHWILAKFYGKFCYNKNSYIAGVGLDRFRPKILTCFLWALIPLSVLLASVLPVYLLVDSLVPDFSLLVHSSESLVLTIGSDPCIYSSRVSPEVHKQLCNCWSSSLCVTSLTLSFSLWLL